MNYSHKLCFGCKEVKPIEEFYRRSENHSRLYSKCKKCHNAHNHKRVQVSPLKPFMKEIVLRCGSQRKAAKQLGIDKRQLRYWMGLDKRRDTGKYQTTISRESATRIVTTLLHLQENNVYYIHEGKPGPKPFWLKVDDAEAERKRRERAA